MSLYSQVAGNQAKTILLMAGFVVVFAALFWAIGLYFGDSRFFLIIGLAVSFFSTFFSYFYSDKVVLMTVQAIPADRKTYFDLYTVTENLAMAGGIPMPKVYVINDPSPNAFATGRDPKHAVVCATTGLLEMMDRTELEGVIAHELSHIRNFDILVTSIAAVLVGTIALVSDWVMRSLWWGDRGSDRENRNPIMIVVLVISLILTPIVATVIQLAVSRRREFMADASGALLTRYPEGLARALEKIESYPVGVHSATSSTAHLFISNPLRTGDGKASWMRSLFSTHPSTKERIRILRSM